MLPILYRRGLSTGAFRGSTESWTHVMRDLKRRGMRAPVLAIGDGGLGFWAAVRDVWPETAEQRDSVHRISNVLDKLPKRLQAKAKEALREIRDAPTREAANDTSVRTRTPATASGSSHQRRPEPEVRMRESGSAVELSAGETAA